MSAPRNVSLVCHPPCRLVAGSRYYIGVWNTPIFGKNDAAFTVKTTVEAERRERTWVDEAETMYLPSTPRIAGFVSWGSAVPV